jgi:hypothetical protein
MATSSPAAVTTRQAESLVRDRLLIALAYALAWLPMVVNRGYFWDDWVLVGQSPGDLLSMFNELGLPIGALAYAAVLATPLPGLIGHWLTFLVYLLATVGFHAVLRRVPGLTRRDALVAAVIFAVLPVNYARMALIDLMYGISLLAFVTATWLVIRFLETRAPWRRIAALALFLLSFYTASMLVLYVVPIALAFVLLRTRDEGRLPGVLWRHADFLALPVAYWVVKSTLFAPYGTYEGYNALTVRNLLEVPEGMLAVPWQVLIEPFGRAVAVAGPIGIVIAIVVAVAVVWRNGTSEDHGGLPTPALALIGVAILALGIFAYLAVGRVPVVWDWSSRHQLLVPIGAGLLGAAVARGFGAFGRAGRTIGLAVIGVLVGIAVVADARTLVAYQLDWFKQEAIIQAVRTTPELAGARHIVVTDGATSLNALRRTYRFYEYNALFGEALGGSDRLVTGLPEPAPELLPRFIARPRYHMRDYQPTPPDRRIELTVGERAGGLELLALLMLEATGSPDFGPEVARLVRIETSMVGGSVP